MIRSDLSLPVNTNGDNLPSADVLFGAIVGVAFHPRHSLHVHPRHVQVTVPQARGDRILLRGVSESNGEMFFSGMHQIS